MVLTSNPADEPKGRDRTRTEAAILEASKAVLAENGFQGFGINAVARRAGCDKQLIYRYFGGIEGLVEAIGKELADWIRDEISPVADESKPKTYGELTEKLLLAFLSALRTNPLVQKIAAWEISEKSPLVLQLSNARSVALSKWVNTQRGDLAPPKGVDAPAVNAFLLASLQHLVLSATSVGRFAGLSLKSDTDWQRVEQTALFITRQIYSGDGGEMYTDER